MVEAELFRLVGMAYQLVAYGCVLPDTIISNLVQILCLGTPRLRSLVVKLLGLIIPRESRSKIDMLTRKGIENVIHPVLFEQLSEDGCPKGGAVIRLLIFLAAGLGSPWELGENSNGGSAIAEAVAEAEKLTTSYIAPAFGQGHVRLGLSADIINLLRSFLQCPKRVWRELVKDQVLHFVSVAAAVLQSSSAEISAKDEKDLPRLEKERLPTVAQSLGRELDGEEEEPERRAEPQGDTQMRSGEPDPWAASYGAGFDFDDEDAALAAALAASEAEFRSSQAAPEEPTPAQPPQAEVKAEEEEYVALAVVAGGPNPLRIGSRVAVKPTEQYSSRTGSIDPAGGFLQTDNPATVIKVELGSGTACCIHGLRRRRPTSGAGHLQKPSGMDPIPFERSDTAKSAASLGSQPQQGTREAAFGGTSPKHFMRTPPVVWVFSGAPSFDHVDLVKLAPVADCTPDPASLPLTTELAQDLKVILNFTMSSSLLAAADINTFSPDGDVEEKGVISTGRHTFVRSQLASYAMMVLQSQLQSIASVTVALKT
ncbi:unnamed protein product, partial [Symbiodinium sp. KB8]